MNGEPLESHDVRGAAVRGLRWVAIACPLVECMLVGAMVVLARLIPPADFGHFAVATLISGIGPVSASAITSALVQRPSVERQHLQAGFAAALLAAGVFFGLMLIAASAFIEPVLAPRRRIWCACPRPAA